MSTRRVSIPQAEYLSIAKAAALYDVSEAFLRRRINQGQLSAVRCGRQIIRMSRAIGFCPEAVMKPARWRPRELPGGGHGICPLGGGHHRVEVRG